MFEYLDLEGCIKMYAVFIVQDIPMQRIDLHMRLCELLNTDYEHFRPFEAKNFEDFHTEAQAERYLRKKIREFKKSDNPDENDTGGKPDV